MTSILRRIIFFLLIFCLAACTSKTPTSTKPPAGGQPTSTQPILTQTPVNLEPSPTASPRAAPTSAVTSTPTQAPLQLINPSLVVLAKNLPGPDDLLLGPDKVIYLSDVVDGTIKKVLPTGEIKAFLSGLAEPEGMVLLPDGSMIIAEQGKNRLVRWDAKTGVISTFINLKNLTNQLGVDGIALLMEANQPEAILIPDSPNGTVLKASLDGKVINQVYQGLLRPTGVWPEPDGSLLIVDENGGTLSRLSPDGKLDILAHYQTPDDVVEDPQGNIFVNTMGDGAIHIIRAGSSQDEILIGGLSSPQGLILDAEENLVVSEPGRHRLVKIIIH